MQKIFKNRTKVEPNHTPKMKEMILKYLTENKLYSTEEYSKSVLMDAAYRLFRNTQPPNDIINLVKLKLPRLVELISNVTLHATEQMVHSNNNGKLHANEINFVTNKILSYMIVEKLLDIQSFNLPKPNPENVKEIIEYQQIFDIKVEITISNFASPLIKKAKEYINEILEINKKIGAKEEISWPNSLSNIIVKVRQSLCNKKKEQWIIYEEAIEKIINISAKQNLTENHKAKPGRPKKNKTYSDIDINHSSKFMMDFLAKSKCGQRKNDEN